MLIAGRYQLQDPIGRGAMGEVWRAYDETLGRPVAVKLLLPQDSDPTATSRFRLEAQTAGRLHHPYVVGVLDFGAHDDRLFLVMELVDGDSLARVLADAGPQPAERVARIAAQAAAGLAAAHQQGIVHRDIKPANLLLDADGTLKIGDFGIARFLDDPAAALTATGQIVGTSLYLAPERALGRPAGPASDVYSLGCVLYQLLTGRPPFQADTPIAILHQHLDATPVPPRQLGAELPPAFESYLLGLLAKQPEHRPGAAQVAEWFAAGAWQGRPEPLPATAPTPAAPTPVAPRSQPRSPRLGETGPATTYMLPSSPRTASRRRSRPGTREVLMRPRVLGTAAAVALFLAAMVIGMLWFSPDNTAAEGSKDSPSATATPTPSLSPSGASATPDAGTSPTPVAAKTSEKAKDEKRERRRQADDEGDDGEGDGGDD
ncbi:serine/threonine protein kinase [Streptomyces spinoverrucosus]|uniref:serine/threonine-protein kinase n=1 Tax=Streptomyces spinoverrucosus TaxID=284043 RepID=UPI0018C3E721|nr:serine/threonine-protein kinase [Streptomyces spinoverrucosus]MBG0850933.1 serine/threonine protein kinase [Streptomyces spinoverrucosus]